MHMLGIDIGGTFTDFVLLCDGQITVHKLLSTPANPAQALLEGVATLGSPPTIVHGTTIATNALLERRGARTALLTTYGFADVLVIGRGTRPSLYDLHVQRPPPLVPAEWRLEVVERIAADGRVLTALDRATLAAAIQRLIADDVESVAICFLHSYANPTHEEQAVAALEAVCGTDGRPRFFVCSSSAVLPEYREYERTSTTTVNAYVAPVLDRYLRHLEQELSARSVATLRIMASDGGSMSAHNARRLAARTTLSGPAGGVVGALGMARQVGISRIISFDMGGTSTDVALCDGELPQTSASNVGDMPVRLPSIAIHTVGAGGGSLARLDAGGALRVGPQSAGADPGPACYGRGDQPTVTDANLLLGRLRTEAFLGGAMTLDAARAESALTPLANDLGMDVATVALGIVRVANAAMERAIRTISVERGKDPRHYVLVAFGGAGPLHAAYLATALGMQQVLVPRYPGVLSALGMLMADITRDYVQFLAHPLDTLAPEVLAQHMQRLALQGWKDLRHDAGAAYNIRADFTLDLRYRGQSHEISTPLITWTRADDQVTGMTIDRALLQTVAERFHGLHQQQSGHTLPTHPVEVVALRLKMIGTLEPVPWATIAASAEDRPSIATTGVVEAQPGTATVAIQAALDPHSAEMRPARLYERAGLHDGDMIAGPAIVTQLDATTVIPPGWSAKVVPHGHLLLTRQDRDRQQRIDCAGNNEVKQQRTFGSGG